MPATLQVTLAPLDVRFARHTLGHLVRRWGPQVDEVLLVVDQKESPFRARTEQADVRAARAELDAVVAELSHPGLRAIDVDRSAAARRRTAARFGARRLPDSDFRGRPYYTYLYGLAEARRPYVLHVDSDMMFGGGSQTWIAEAIEWFKRDETLVTCGPLPGPPRIDGGALKGQEGYPYETVAENTYKFDSVSTRVFLADMGRVEGRLGTLAGKHIPTLRSVVGSTLRRQVNWMPLEERITLAMRQTGSGRLDFLGTGDGMWSVHPIDRSPAFYASLGSLIALLEDGSAPTDEQRGHYDLDDSMIALAAARTPA
jgi:hypothetical protein